MFSCFLRFLRLTVSWFTLSKRENNFTHAKCTIPELTSFTDISLHCLLWGHLGPQLRPKKQKRSLHPYVSKPSWAKTTFARYIFWKFDTSLEKSTTNRFLEFFLKLLSRYNRLSKQYFIRFLYGAGPLVTSSLAWLLRSLKSSLRSLTNSWNSIPR